MNNPNTKVFLSSAESDAYSIRGMLKYIPSTQPFREFLQNLYRVLISQQRWPEEKLPLLHRSVEQILFSLDVAWLDYQDLLMIPDGQPSAENRLSFSAHSIDQDEPHIIQSTWPVERNERFKGEIQHINEQEIQSPRIFYQKFFTRRSHGDWKRCLSRWVETALDDRTIFDTQAVSPAEVYDDYIDLVKLMEVNWLQHKETNP